MEILKVGDELLVNGYKSITLSGSMEANIASFAEVNNLSAQEAERILSAVPALQNFAAGLISNDQDEENVVLDMSTLDEVTNSAQANSIQGANLLSKAGDAASTTSTLKGTSSVNGVTFEYEIPSTATSPQVNTTYSGIKITGVSGTKITITSCAGKEVEINGTGLTVTLDVAVKKLVNNASSSTIVGSTAANNIVNTASAVGTTIRIPAGNDSQSNVIENRAKNAVIDCSAMVRGKTTITNNYTGYGAVIKGGQDAARTVITNYSSAFHDQSANKILCVDIQGGSGVEEITNYGQGAKIDTGDGGDTIVNHASAGYVAGTRNLVTVEINSGAGSDNIINHGHGVKMNAGIGTDDVITNYGTSLDFGGENKFNLEMTGGAGQTTYNNYNNNVFIDFKDGKDILNQNANYYVNVSNIENGDVLPRYSANITQSTRGHGNGVFSWDYIKNAILLNHAIAGGNATDSVGRITRMYADSDGKNYYDISYSENKITVTYKENGVTKEIYEIDSSSSTEGKLSKQTIIQTCASGATRSVTTNYKADGTTVDSILYVGKDESGSPVYSVESHYTGEYPKVITSTEKDYAEILFSADGTPIQVRVGAIIDASGNVTYGTKKWTKDGNEIVSSNSVGSISKLHSMDSAIVEANMTDIVYDTEGRVSTFKIGNAVYEVTYTETETRIKKTEGRVETASLYDNTSNKVKQREVKTKDTTAADSPYTSALTKYNNGIFESVTYTNNPKTYEVLSYKTSTTTYPKISYTSTKATIEFSATRKVEIPSTNFPSGSHATMRADGSVEITDTEGRITIYSSSGVVTGSTTRTNDDNGYCLDIASDFDSSGNPRAHEYRGYTSAGELNYSVSNIAGSGITVSTTSSSATITFANGQTIVAGNGASVRVERDGNSYKVTVTETADGVTTTTVYNVNKEIKSQNIRRNTSDGYVDDLRTYTNNTETRTIKGYTNADGKVNYTVNSVYTGSDMTVTTTATQATIQFTNGQAMTVDYGSTAAIRADGTVEVVQKNGVIIRYNKDGSVAERIVPQAQVAQPSHPDVDNSDEIKNILGFFNLPADTVVVPVMRNGKVVGVEVSEVRNGETLVTKYEITGMDAKGVVTETTITRPDGQVAVQTYPGAVDEITRINNEIEHLTEDVLYPIILSMINAMRREGTRDISTEVQRILTQLVEGYKDGDVKGLLYAAIPNAFASQGHNTYEINKALESMSANGRQIIDACERIRALINELRDAEAKPTSERVHTVGSVTFKVVYDKAHPDSYNIAENADGTITITANNCTIDVLDMGVTGRTIIINGENVTFNSNEFTMAHITNNAKDSTINLSHGNDNIENTATATGTTINGVDGDNTIVNRATGVTINGGASDDIIRNYGGGSMINGGNGNDTIYNYATSGRIDGGNGTDAINYVNGTTNIVNGANDVVTKILPEGSDGNPGNGDNIDPSNPGTNPSDDTSYDFSRQFTVNGVTFTVYSNEAIPNVSTSVEQHTGILVINAPDNCKVLINSAASNLAKIKLNGSHINFHSNVKLEMYNNAADSTINGSSYDDTIANLANNVTINGLNGADKIYNYNDNITIDAGAGNDYISNQGNNVTISGGAGADEIHNFSENNVSINSDSSDTVRDYANTSATPQANNSNPGSNASESVETEATVRSYMRSSTAINAILSDSEYDTFISKYLAKAEYNTYDKVMALLRQIEVVYEKSDKDSTTIGNIKACMISGTCFFNNEVLADAQILVDAANQNEMSEEDYIKSKMVITVANNATITQMLAASNTGDVVNKAGKLYYNNGTNMLELAITEEQYLELFQPVTRFMVEQADNEDCFFISTALVEGMENLQMRGKLLTCFSSDSAGNITVRFPGMPNTSVTFTNGELKTTTNIVSGSKGLQMLEQAYAIIKFQKVANSNISIDDIRKIYSDEFADAVSAVGKNNVPTIVQAMTVYKNGWYAGDVNIDHDKNEETPNIPLTGVLNEILSTLSNSGNNHGYNVSASNVESLASKINNDSYAVTVKTYSYNKDNPTLVRLWEQIKQSIDTKAYQIEPSHQYSIERIDTVAGKIYIKNPWDSYTVIEMTIADFKKCFVSIDWRTV